MVLVSSFVTRAVCRMPSRFCSNKIRTLQLLNDNNNNTITTILDGHYENYMCRQDNVKHQEIHFCLIRIIKQRGSYRGDLQQFHRGLRLCVACGARIFSHLTFAIYFNQTTRDCGKTTQDGFGEFYFVYVSLTAS